MQVSCLGLADAVTSFLGDKFDPRPYVAWRQTLQMPQTLAHSILALPDAAPQTDPSLLYPLLLTQG